MKKHGVQVEYSKITNYIYLGSNECCETFFKKKLLAQGIQADISLEIEKLDQPHGVNYFLWLPTPDKQPPTAKQLELGVSFMEELIANRIKMYVHCKYGHGRSPTLVVAYFVAHGSLSLQAAIDFVKAKRPEVHFNAQQLAGLRAFAQKHK